MYKSIKKQIINEMASKDFNYANPVLDGRIARFDRNGQKNAWFIGHEGRTRTGTPIGFAIFGDWKEGTKFNYRTDWNYTEIEKIELNHFIAKKKTETDLVLKKDRVKAQQESKDFWNKSLVDISHPYLSKKKIDALYGGRIYQKGNQKLLVLQVRNCHNDLKGLQKITEDGEKRFVFGQENKGNFITIPSGHCLKGKQEIYIVEGFATGASIHMATNRPVVCALNANNLVSVCWELKKFNSQLGITIAADDDQKTSGNPGRTKGLQAAQEIGASIVFPNFKENSASFSDFNDVHVLFGIDVLKEQLTCVEKIKPTIPPATILATQFIKEKKMKVSEKRLVAWRRDFYQFTGKCYTKLLESDLLNDLVKFLQRHPLAYLKAGKNFGKEVLSNVEAKTNIKSDKSIPFWISDPEIYMDGVICLANGLINLSDASEVSEIEVLPHNPDLFQITSLPFNFERNKGCERWLSFLNQMLPDKNSQMALQEWFGLNLIFDNSFQKFAIFYGQGANGKTVCCVVLRSLLGEKNVAGVNLEAFDPKRTFNLASTVGKLANIVEELNVNSKTEEGEIKKFVSGGVMTVERKHKDPFEIFPTARLTFATNNLPNLNDTSDGIWRRVLLFPFKEQILDPQKQDRNLVDANFWINSGELPGIFNWALEGLFRLKVNKKFTESDEMSLALKEFRIDSNPTKDFLLDFCEAKRDSIISSKVLFEVYQRHMIDCGYPTFKMSRFISEIKSTFPSVKKSDNAITHNGVRARMLYGIDFKDMGHI